MDRLTLMRTLLVASQAKSFSAAARQLGLSSSQVARQVTTLERQLGVKLVIRNARSLALTDEGCRYRDFSRRVMQTLQEQDAAVRELSQRPEGDLAVISPKWIGSLELAEAIAAFAARNPRINVRFDTSPGRHGDRLYSFVHEGYDIAFYTRPLRDSSVRCRQVAALPFVLCGSEAYLHERGAPGSPRQLSEHDAIVHRNDPVWHLSHDGSPFSHKIPRPAFTTNTYLVAQRAALQGVGLALLPLSPVLPEVRSGRLRVLDAFSAPERPLYAVYPPGLQSVRKIRLFLDFVAAWFSDARAAPLACTVGQEGGVSIAADAR